MGRKRIGFVRNDGDDEHESKEGEDFFLKMFTVNKEHVKKFIEACYNPTGSTELKEFKTSAEILYMLRETIDVSITVVNEVMGELGYELKYIDQIPNWVLYTKAELLD